MAKIEKPGGQSPDNPKPTALEVLPENIPAAPRKGKLMVTWRYYLEGDRWRKPPVLPTGKFLVHRADTYGLKKAVRLHEDKTFNSDGIDRICADGIHSLIDFDNCVEHGIAVPEYQDIVEWLDTYTEISPSGEGLR